MNQKSDVLDRAALLLLAAESVLPAVPGCAGRVQALGGQPTSPALPRVPAVDHFGPFIAARWDEWLKGRDPQEQRRSLEVTAQLGPQAAGGIIDEWFSQRPASGTPEDLAVVREYLAAIPAMARELLQELGPLPETRSEATESWEVARLLPINAPPFPVGSDVPGTPYRLEELLGCGGFGAVYKAANRFEQHSEPRALKFCLNPDLLPSLKRERDLLDRLMTVGKQSKWSDRVVKLFGHNLDAPVPFLVYEYISGGSLVRQLAAVRRRTGKALQPGQVLGLVRRICEPVAFAHQLGLVHRDIKPSNVLVSGSTLKLADFGIGGVVAEHAARSTPFAPGQRSLSGQSSVFRGAGTPLYMSPEQRRGEKPDPRQDVYSIGVLWYQLLVNDCSRELHQGWADELADEHKVPRRHIELIQACVGYLKKRPANAGELLKLLPAPNNAAPAARSDDYRVIGTQAVSVSGLAFGGDFRRLFTAGSDGVVRVWDTDAAAEVAECKLWGRAVHAVAVTADNRQALFCCDGNVACLWDVPGAMVAFALRGHAGKVPCGAFAPDSRLAATGSGDGSIRLWNVTDGKEEGRIDNYGTAVSGVTFSADGARVVSCDEGGRIMVHLAETGWEIRPPLDQQDWLTCLALSPDGRIVASGGKSSLALWDLRAGERLHTLRGHDMAVMAVAFTRDGRHLISAGLDHLRLWDVAQGRLVHTFQGHGGGLTSLAMSPTGRHFATGGFDRTVRMWSLPEVS